MLKTPNLTLTEIFLFSTNQGKDWIKRKKNRLRTVYIQYIVISLITSQYISYTIFLKDNDAGIYSMKIPR